MQIVPHFSNIRKKSLRKRGLNKFTIVHHCVPLCPIQCKLSANGKAFALHSCLTCPTATCSGQDHVSTKHVLSLSSFKKLIVRHCLWRKAALRWWQALVRLNYCITILECCILYWIFKTSNKKELCETKFYKYLFCQT